MEPDYSTYTVEELNETLQHIDHSVFPDRVQLIQNELEERQKASKQSDDLYYEIVEESGRFNACPSCLKPIGFFKTVRQRNGQLKHCHHCTEPYVLKTDYRFALILGIPLALLTAFFVKPALRAMEIDPFFVTPLLTVSVLLASFRLKKVRFV